VAIGGGAGTAGNGGLVTVDMNGNIETYGVAAFGILAQSIGGGGGIAGNVDREIGEDSGLNLAFGQGGGNGGDGKKVTVTTTGNINTRGTNATGIFAQSIGGGGGLAGDIGPGIGFAGTVGGSGSAGEVDITHTGNITTYGDNSNGIFAQSAAGGVASKVDITLSGDILTRGANSSGIVAQSLGGNGNGNISLDILSGSVVGGSGSGAGVSIRDGAANTISNYGTITTLGGIAGRAIVATTGSETIDNYGTVTGSVDLGAGTNTFNNRPGGLLNAGETVNVGSGNTLTNQGTLSPGGKGTIQTTTLTGNLVQTNSGTFLADLDPQNGNSDHLLVSGTAGLAGSVAVNTINAGRATPGTQQATILSSANGVTNSGLGLSSRPSAVIGYELLFPNTTDVAVGTSIDFAPNGLSPNQAAVGKSINAIQRAGGSESFAPIAAQLCSLPEIRSLGSAYDQLGPVSYDNLTLTTFETNRQYTRTFQHRMNAIRSTLYAESRDLQAADSSAESPLVLAFNGSNASVGDLLSMERRAQEQLKYGLWLQPLGQWGDQNEKEGQQGYKYGMGGIAGGFDYLVSPNLIAGLGIGYFNADVDLDQNSGSGRVISFAGSPYATYFTDRFYFEGVLAYARNEYDDSRNMTIGSLQSTANSKHYGNAYSGSLEGGYNLWAQEWMFQPLASLGYVYLDEEAFDEEGAGGENLTVDSRQTSDLILEVGLRVSRAFKVDGGSVVPELKAAWLHDFDIDHRRITASFDGFPGAAFTVAGRDIERDGALVGAGITYPIKSGITVALHYEGEFWGDYDSQAVYGQLRYDF
jgi:outer membrane autotransporter protein